MQAGVRNSRLARRSFRSDRRSISPFTLSPSSRRVRLIGCRSSMSASSFCLSPSNRSSRAKDSPFGGSGRSSPPSGPHGVRNGRATSLRLKAISLLAVAAITPVQGCGNARYNKQASLIYFLLLLFRFRTRDPDHFTPDRALLGGKRSVRFRAC